MNHQEIEIMIYVQDVQYIDLVNIVIYYKVLIREIILFIIK